MRLLTTLSVAIALTAGVAARGQNLLLNPSFELGGANLTSTIGHFLDWTSLGNSYSGANLLPSANYDDGNGVWSIQYTGTDFNNIPDGNFFAELAPYNDLNLNTGGPTGGLGYLSQTLSTPTIPGEVYKVSFYLSENSEGDPDQNNFDFTATAGATSQEDVTTQILTTTPQIDINSGNNAPYLNTGSGASSVWIPLSFDYTATSASTTLQFGFEVDDTLTSGVWAFDDASITAVPDSGVGFGLIAATLCGLCGLSFYTNRHPRLAQAILRRS